MLTLKIIFSIDVELQVMWLLKLLFCKKVKKLILFVISFLQE